MAPLRHPAGVVLLPYLLFAVLLPACGEPPSWQRLLAAKIKEQYPDYQVHPMPEGKLLVKRPGSSEVPVDVDELARFCRRGPKDCDYATDQLLLEPRGN